MASNDYRRCFVAALPEDMAKADDRWGEQNDYAEVGTLADGRKVFHCLIESRLLKNLADMTDPKGRLQFLGRNYKDLMALDPSIWEPVIECTWAGARDEDGNPTTLRDKVATKKATAPARAYVDRKIAPHQFAGWDEAAI